MSEVRSYPRRVATEAGEEWPELQKLIDGALDAQGVSH